MSIYKAYRVTIKGTYQMVVVNESRTLAYPFEYDCYSAEEWAEDNSTGLVNLYVAYCTEDGDLAPALAAIDDHGELVWEVEV